MQDEPKASAPTGTEPGCSEGQAAPAVNSAGATTIWKSADGMLAPEQRECQEFAWGKPDSAGEFIQPGHLHFLDERSAWLNIIRNVEAGLRMSANDVIRARETLAGAEKHAADTAIEYTTVQRGYRAFLLSVSQGGGE